MFRKLLVCVLLLSCPSKVRGQHIISTVAGGGPNNIPALQAGIGAPTSVFKDSAGNLYFGAVYSVFKVDGKGTLTRVVGTGGPGSAGDGGPATSAHLLNPSGVFVDGSGNIYIADDVQNAIRKVVAATGIIQTVAGNGTPGYSGDGGVATSAQLNGPFGVFVDANGNIFFSDTSNHVIREVVATTGIIRTVAGNGASGLSGDGGPATSAQLNSPDGLCVDAAGNIFIADTLNSRIREVLASNGTIQTVAGTVAGYSGDGGPATSAQLGAPWGVFVSGGNIFIADTANSVIREVSASNGTIRTVAGMATAPGFSGDGGPATNASLLLPFGVYVDPTGNIFIADNANNRIREVFASNGVIQTIAGNGTLGFSGNGGPAIGAQLNIPAGVFVNGGGDIFIADSLNDVIREVAAATGNIQTVAGIPGNQVTGGDGGPATSASLVLPLGVYVDPGGNIFISELAKIRKVSASGIIQTVAGTGVSGYGGDGGTATNAQLSEPVGVFVDGSGNIFIADSLNNRIREVFASNGIIQTVAGSGTAGFSGDGGPATSAELNAPTGVYVDPSGNIFFADGANFCVREIRAADKTIHTVAGICTSSGFSGDGGPATAAQLSFPAGIFVDSTGNLFIADAGNSRVREVNAATGIIQTVVGSGTFGFSGDGGPALSAEIAPSFFVSALWGDGNSNLYISDPGNGRIRKVTGLVAGPPANITATGGASQSTVISTAFPSPLAATVTDASGNAVAGVTVTFTAPTSGATGTFVDGVSSTTATTNTAGVATSPVFTANGTLGSYMVTATAAGVAGSAAFNLTNASTLVIATTTLPPATVGTAYSSTLQAKGGVPPYAWSISAGTLPAGLTLNSSTGAITGTPSSGGTSTFTVQVTDSETPAVSQSAGLSLTVSGNLGSLIVLPQPNTVGVGASVQLFAQDASGNKIPATWSVSPATGAGTISATGLYQAPASSTSQTVTVTATAVADSTKLNSVSFMLAPNGLNACCQLPQQLAVASGSTSAPTGVQLNGAPVSTASTVPFALSCSGLPVGAGCIFTLPRSSTIIQAISGTSPIAFCSVFTTGSGAGATARMINRFRTKNPRALSPPFHAVVVLCLVVLALLLTVWRPNEPSNTRRVALATVTLVCISVGMLGACNGFSKANVAPPTGQATPAGTYHILILATPPPGSGFVQNQLIVPLTVTP